MMKLLNNSLFLVALCVVAGQVAGSRKIRHFKLGSSATLFVGLLTSYFAVALFHTEVKVADVFFSLSLAGFIASVGLMAAQSIGAVLKEYGLRFVALSMIVTMSGALTAFAVKSGLPLLNYHVIGTYVGALTSSPGLATALELAKGTAVDRSAAVGLGYSIAYVPGILMVTAFAQVMGKIYGSEKSVEQRVEAGIQQVKPFPLTGFFFVILAGILLGTLAIPVGKQVAFSLGMTGGVMVSALFFGNRKKSGYFDFDSKHLEVVRDISLSMFLAIVGLNYGYEAFSAIQQFGIQLLLIGLVTSIISISMGYMVGRYVLKIDQVYLVGGICGGMTSTPGLAAAIDEFGSGKVIAGYGAAYPFALLMKIIFTKLLFMS